MWDNEKRQNQAVYVAPGVEQIRLKDKVIYQKEAGEAETILDSPEFEGRIPRFDLAVASSLAEIDAIVRPGKDHENSLVRPRGAILFKGAARGNPLLDFIARGGSLRSSRCGDFHMALDLVRKNSDIAGNLSHYMISHMFPVNEIETAFQYARQSNSVKVVVKHK